MAGREVVVDCLCEPGLRISDKQKYNLEFLRERFLDRNEGYPHRVTKIHLSAIDGKPIGGFKDTRENLEAKAPQINSLVFIESIGLGPAYRKLTTAGFQLILPQDGFPEQFELGNSNHSSETNGRIGTLQELHLIEWSTHRDPEAFGRLIEMYSPDALNHAYHRLGNIHDAEDIVSQATLRAWRAIDRFDLNKAIGNKPFSPWFGQIVHNLIADHYRNKGRHLDSTLNSQIPAGDEVDPQLWVERKFTIEELRKGLKQLGMRQPLYRQMILMKFLDGLSHSEIASTLQEKEVTVRVQLHRALKELGRLTKPHIS